MRVFAQKGTSEKVVLDCPVAHIQTMAASLNERLGGEWVYVEYISLLEAIPFNDGVPYYGFDGKDRYVKEIIKLT